MKIPDQIRKTIKRYHLIRPGDKVLVGVSGGPDSVFLLEILYRLRHELGVDLHTVHVNHHLRSGADTDEHFVRRLCKKLCVPLTTIQLHLKTRMTKGGSREEIAREERLKAILKTARKVKADRIALAHHQDDLAETVLMRILRGTGLNGLRAILPVRQLQGHTVIRPLIGVNRRDVKTYLRKHNLSFRTDPTNRDTTFFRNRIRHKLLPLLAREYQTGIVDVLANLANSAADDYDYLSTHAQQRLQKLRKRGGPADQILIPVEKLKKEHPSLQRLIIRCGIAGIRDDTNTLTLQHLHKAEDLLTGAPDGSIVDLPQGLQIKKDKDHLRIQRLSRNA